MKRLLRVSKHILLLWLGLTLIPLLYYWYASSKTQDEVHIQLQTQGLLFLSYVNEKANAIYSEIDQTSYEIGHSSLLYDFAHQQDPQLKKYLEKQWYISSLNSSRFDQLRFLDERGNEVIRIDFPHGSERPSIAPINHLQNKAHRDYFLFSKKLKTNQAGYFGIDLEYEHGKAILPYKPGFRIIHPIDRQQQKYSERLGYFIANLDVLQLINDITINSQKHPVHFINQQGFYVLSSEPYKLFGHLISERQHFQVSQQHPGLWQKIQQQPGSGSHLTDEGLYIYREVHTPLFGNIEDLTLITLYPLSLLNQTAETSINLLRLEVGIIWLTLGGIAGMSAVMFDIYRRNQIAHAFTNLLLESSNAIVLTDYQFNILRANGRYMDLTGFHHEQLIGEKINDFQKPPLTLSELRKELCMHHYWKGSLDVRTADQQLINCEVEVRPLTQHQTELHYFVHSFTDISAHHQRIAELQMLSECDSATKLWNKAKFVNLLAEQSRLVSRYKQHPSSCLAIIDIDDFKSINDSRGHAFGDTAILHVANTLQQVMRDSDSVGRIGGDEFAMIIQHITPDLALKLMLRIKDQITNWSEHPISISVGLTEIGPDWQESFELADQALYRAKQAGRNCVIVHGINNISAVDTHSA